MSTLWRIEGEAVKLRFHAAQQAAWDSTRRFVFLISGTQSGKTSFCSWWLWREIQRCGPGDYLAVTATFDLFKLKFLPELRQVFEHLLGVARYWPGNQVLELKDPATGRFLAKQADDAMWARIILRSAQSEGGLESATAKAAILDECGMADFGLDAWEAVQRRLSLSQGRVFGGTTPYNLGWLKTEILDRWKAGDQDYHVIQAESIVNPAFPLAEFERARRTMPAWKFDMFYRGLMGRPEGLIYADYRDEIGAHLVKPFAIPPEWPRYVGIDFGAVNTVTIWIAEDVERGAYYLYRETLEGGQSTKEHAASALSRSSGERVIAWYGGSGSEIQQRLDWLAAGIPVLGPPFDNVESGIDRVIGLLREKRLFVFENCRGVRDEFARYMRKVDQSGQVTEAIRDKENFHRLDGLRYNVIGMTQTLPEPAGGMVYAGGGDRRVEDW